MSEDALRARIEDLEKEVRDLRQNLIHDPLTGLKTRAFFDQEARVYVDIVSSTAGNSGSRRRKWFGFKDLSFVFIDIDFFKDVNDTHGHLVGDEVLKSIAETVRTSVRAGDTAARWGGEEIVITLVGATERDAAAKAEDIRRQVEATKFGKHPDLTVTISAGIASYESGLTFEQMIDRADRALYAAKKGGRNRIVTYSSQS